MTQTDVIQATLLFGAMPVLPDEKLRTDLRALAGRHNLPTAGEAGYRDGLFRLGADPYEITVQPVESPLPAASFTGALSGHINSSLRRPLAAAVADHSAHIRIAVRDTRAEPGKPLSTARVRQLSVFAQDVLRLMLKLLPPMALHWHPSNTLALPVGLAGSAPGKLFLPLCLRLRNTSSLLTGTPEVNFAQAIEGSADLLGKPLHVMATSLDRYESMDLAVAFITQCLESEGGAVAGTVFRDKKGTRVQVVDHKPCEAAPAGLLALVELGQMDRRPSFPAELLSRETVMARVTAERSNRSRDLDGPNRRLAATLTAAQSEALRRSVARIDADEAAAAEPALPQGAELRALRDRTASQPRNSPDDR